MIIFEDISKSFGQRLVLEKLRCSIKHGELVFVVGKSGVGKSVMLKLIVGLMKPDAGQIWVDGEEVTHLSEAALTEVRKKCGYVFQQPALLDSMTVAENIGFGLRAHSLAESEEHRDGILERTLHLVHLPRDVMKLYPSQLSFGMQKRVAIARAIAMSPSYLLFDEPTTGLDPVATTRVSELIRELSKNLKVTSIVVSHDMHCALKYADRILCLDEKKIVLEGSPTTFLESASGVAADFMMEAKLRYQEFESCG